MRLEHALVGHPFGHASHQAVLIDSVEKFLEVDVNHHVVAVGDVLLCLGHGLMSGASRTESVAVLGKRRVPLLLEYLQQRLLDQAIDDAWHAEPSDAAGRFRDVDPFDRLRCVGSREQLCPDGRPVLPQVGRGVVDGQSVDAGTTLVPTDAFPRLFEIASVAHLLHELVFDSRAVGGSLRREWFGPWAVGGRRFTPPRRRQGQTLLRVLGFLPRSTHESRVLLATPNRSGLRRVATALRSLAVSALVGSVSRPSRPARSVYFALC